MKAREVIKQLREDGWVQLKGKPTGHRQFVHPTKPGKVTVSDQDGDDIRPGTLRSIERQAGWR